MKGNWFLLQRKEVYFIVGVLLYMLVFFMPWSYNITFLNVSLLAWAAYFMLFLGPIWGILLTLSDPKSASVDEKNQT
jgi:glucan phosphoethanolaminetransferase (alkaline phosphatase superfamily)